MNDTKRGEYSRDDLIALCEDAIVPVAAWCDGDSARSHERLGTLWALLRAGCAFRVRDHDADGSCRTDEWTVWVDVVYPGFMAFECGRDENMEEETFYLPTRKRLEEADGRDWY